MDIDALMFEWIDQENYDSEKSISKFKTLPLTADIEFCVQDWYKTRRAEVKGPLVI